MSKILSIILINNLDWRLLALGDRLVLLTQNIDFFASKTLKIVDRLSYKARKTNLKLKII